MFDAASAFETADHAALQRARGTVRVSAKRRGGATVLDRLYQSGSAKARIPRGPGFETVLLNTAGGVAGGDRFEYRVEAASGCAVTVTTQTAERIYRSTGEDGVIESTLTLRADASLDWLPQETILFDGARVQRRLTVAMAAEARLLIIEPLVFGRRAMGETVERGFVSDQWRVRRAGRLIYADALRIDGAIIEVLAKPAALGGAGACASLLYVAPDAEDRVDDLRTALGADGAASAWDGLLAARIVTAEGAALRAAAVRAVSTLRPGPLPRVWFT